MDSPSLREALDRRQRQFPNPLPAGFSERVIARIHDSPTLQSISSSRILLASALVAVLTATSVGLLLDPAPRKPAPPSLSFTTHRVFQAP